MNDARTAALHILERIRRTDSWADALFGSEADKFGLQGRDRAFCAKLCLGVVQNKMLLDGVIALYSNREAKAIEPKVTDILRMGGYELLFMDTPAHAAVNETVALCKGSLRRSSGFVNAVLRKIAACNGSIPALQYNDEAERLSIRYSHPLWLVREWIGLVGAGETEQLLAGNNGSVPITAQVNTLQISPERLLEKLSSENCVAEPHPFLENALILPKGMPTRLQAFADGDFYIQDAAGAISVRSASPKPGSRILDACAAPGGKSFAAAIASGGSAEIISCDLHENKLKRIREGAERLHLSNITAMAADASAFRPEWENAFDLVMTDVPCSGLGVIRKKPEIRYKTPESLLGFHTVQLRILKNCSRYVKPGGKLLYSTCTLRKCENEEVVSEFLDSENGFSLCRNELCPEEIGRTFWPQRDGTDGFYSAILIKNR